MTKVILAVSGGVDSMVLLDMLCRSKIYSSGDIFIPERDLLVAHFDHGIRYNSREDAEFVARIAREIYHIRYKVGRGELGRGASEEAARAARYDFLRQVAAEQGGAKILTAHHLDDLVETVAINLLRGTGWRGLAGLDRPGMERPFLESSLLYEPMDKAAILEYAAKRGLYWREDQTNMDASYLRNRVRAKLAEGELSFEQKLRIYQLWQAQKGLKRDIDQTITSLLPEPGQPWARDWFRNLAPNLALELLRAGTLRAGISATRPQLEDFRQAILAYAPGKHFNLPGDKLIKLNKADFIL